MHHCSERRDRPIEMALGMFSQGRRMCRTLGNRLAWVSDATIAGDLLCVLYGAQTAFVLWHFMDETYQFIGESYL